MYNWSTDTTQLEKDSEKYQIWRLEQLINYGLGEEKLDEELLKHYWKKISMDTKTRQYFEFLLWPDR